MTNNKIPAQGLYYIREWNRAEHAHREKNTDKLNQTYKYTKEIEKL